MNLIDEQFTVNGHPIFTPFGHRKITPLLVSCLLRSGLADQTGFDLFLKPIGVSSNIDSSGVMEDAVEDG